MKCSLSPSIGTERQLDYHERNLCVQNKESCNQAERCIAIRPSKHSKFKPPVNFMEARGSWRL